MLIPQFTIRWLLMLTAAFAVICSIFALARYGDAWAAGVRQTATGVSLAIVSLGMLLLVHASVFALVWIFSVMPFPFRRGRTGSGQSPFLQTPTPPKAPQDVASADDVDTPAAPIILD